MLVLFRWIELRILNSLFMKQDLIDNGLKNFTPAIKNVSRLACVIQLQLW